MAKKPKETRAQNPNSPTSPSSEDISNSLSGGTREEPDYPISVSMFSVSVPFPKKRIDDSRSIPEKLKQLLRLDADGPQNFDPRIIESSDDNSNKRKRKEKLPDGIDSNDSDVERDIKKSKREIGLVSEKSNFDQKKTKRKRIEVEEEYGERKYGEMDLDLDLKQVEGEKENNGKKRKKLDSGEDLLVSEEGFDDEEKLLRTIFVGNLPLKVKKKALLREFGQMGEIESIRIRSMPLLNYKTSKKGAIIKKQLDEAADRVNAYIVFKTAESAQASLSYNMAVVGGNHIHVDRVCSPRKKLKGEKTTLYDSKRTVCIANLPFDVKDEELYQLFTGIYNLKDNSIEAIRVVRDPTSMGKGIAYVLFKTREAANTVVRKHMLKIRDRELRLSRVIKSDSILSKRKEPPSENDYNTSNKKLDVGVGTSYQGNPG